MNLLDEDFVRYDYISSLEKRPCKLCNLLYRSITKHPYSWNQQYVSLFRVHSTFRIDRKGPPLLSIYRRPGDFLNSTLIRTGFPKLPSPGSNVQFQLIRGWLRDCDEKHSCQRHPVGNLPRRVIDVGDMEGLQDMQLKCDMSGTNERYAVLSHRWGEPTGQPKFRTLCKNNIESFKDHINFDDLPQTLKDAVIVTRNLGIRLLWIDSLCIVQDSVEDWITESAKMDEIFNLAYCTIAASSAGSTTEGFLRERQERETIVIQRDACDPLYISEMIDDFHGEIEEGGLNQRGWVLQERALSRRTIYFGEKQLYWECGWGVRCETLTRIYNLKSAFLGDPDFPEYAMRHYKGGRIQLFQGLYEKYSSLSFTFETDRSIAIRGLEQRLLRGFETRGGYGIFECYFHRGLLWKRSEAKLSRIYYPPDRPVPSWSWMYNYGKITYVDLPFGEVDWSMDVISPFEHDPYQNHGQYWMGNQIGKKLGIQAKARRFVSSDLSSSIIFDTDDNYELSSLSRDDGRGESRQYDAGI
ncbi:heterokaryon incompatibility protein-domain-containing protein [Daldinia grandis]|nr:heterokaryon incompatibility protein-domain-containing protein [Daldinia grandis]